MATEDEMLVRAAIRDELTGPLERIRAELKAVGRETEKAGDKANIGARGFDKMASGVGRFAKMAGKAALYGVGGLTLALGAATAAAGYLGIKTAASMQTAQIGFTTMLGSAKKANAFLRDLAKFAAETPFEFPELQTAASSLISAGIATKDVIPIMKTLGDVTAGMGTGSEGIQRATIALQQMNAAQKISAEDLGQLRDAGIPVYDVLSKALGKTKKEVSDLVQKGKLGAPELQKLMHALTSGKGLERFNGLMEKQSHTLAGVWSTLSDTVQMGLAQAFQPMVPILTRATLKASDLAQQAMPAIQHALRVTIKTVREFKRAFDVGGLDGMAKLIQTKYGLDAPKALETARGVIDDVATIITKSLIPAISDAAGVLPSWTTPLGAARDVLGFLADHTTLTKVAIEGLVTTLTVAKAVSLAYAAASKVMAAGEAISLMWLKLHTVGTVENTVVTKAAAVASGLWTAAQWLLNAALTANPIGIVVVAIAALVAGFILAYKKVGWFHDGVNAAFKGIAAAGKWLWNNVLQPVFKLLIDYIGWVLDKWATMLDALSHVPGFGWAKTAANAMHNAADKARELGDNLGKIPDHKDVTIRVGYVIPQGLVNPNYSDPNAGIRPFLTPGQGPKGQGKGRLGDTAHSRAHGGRLGLANTFAAHAAAMAATGARPRITNIGIGGGGHGHGSGDHQAGRALDLQGSGLARYGAHMRALGGYAAFHGTGANRHLHAVPPAIGDTSSSMAARVRSRSTAAGGGIVIEAGAIRVEVNHPAANVDVEQAVANGIRTYLRDREERR